MLLLAESPYLGGITSHLLSIVRAFRDSPRFDICLATLPGRRPDTTLIDQCRTLGISIHVLPMAAPFDVRVRRELRDFLTHHAIDLVHTHNYRATFLGHWSGVPVPVVATCHGMAVDAPWRLKAWQWAERRAMRRQVATVACSEFVRDALIRHGLVPERVRVVHNGFAPPDTPYRPLSRSLLDIPEDRLVVLYVGRLVEGKGIALLIDALADGKDATGLILGDGPLRGTLEAGARSVNADVRFAGAIADPTPYYAIADVVALPSRMEALPMTLIEAAAFGKPCVACRVGGVPEVVEDGRTGMLVDMDDVAAIRTALAAYRDPGLREAHGQAARARWRERFSLEVMARRLAEVYDTAMA